MILEQLKNEGLITLCQKGEEMQNGTIVLRDGRNSLQTGKFSAYDEDDGLILENVIDLNTSEVFAERGILRPGEDDTLYRFNSQFGDDIYSREAIAILKKWSLYKQYSQLQQAMTAFVCSAFSPEYVMFLEKNELLNLLFVPIQHQFKIGRFIQKEKWEDINLRKFRKTLNTLIENQYITYMGYLPSSKTVTPMFYTIGNDTHLETDTKLKNEPFIHTSNCGGNIKLVKHEENEKIFAVDAGSSYKGNGANSSAKEASGIANHLKRMYPEYNFVPVSGRGATGTLLNF